MTLAYVGFYPRGLFLHLGAFLPSVVHLVFFVAVVKILTGKDQSRLFFSEGNRFPGIAGRLHFVFARQFFRISAAVSDSGSGHFLERRDPAVGAKARHRRYDSPAAAYPCA